MKKTSCLWLLGGIFAVLSAAALIFLRGRLGTAALIAAAAVTAFLAARFAALRYEMTDPAIKISGGLIFKRVKLIERAAILSVSRVYLGRLLIFTVVRTAGSTDLLFCSLPEP